MGTIWLPPLRARRDDIISIARHYLKRFRSANMKRTLRLASRGEQLLRDQRWPGNVRELVNSMERLVVMAQGEVIEADDVRRAFVEQRDYTTQSVPDRSAPVEAESSPSALDDPHAKAPVRTSDLIALRSSTADIA